MNSMTSVTTMTSMHSVNSATSMMSMKDVINSSIKPQYRKVYIPIGVYRYGDRIWSTTD